MVFRQTTRTILVFGLGLTGLSSTAVLAQQDTLKSAAQKAVLSNPEVLQKWHAYQAAVNEKDVAFGGYLPRVDLAAGIGREQRDDPLLRANYSRHSTTLTLTQMLYDGFATRNEVKRLDHARQVRFFELLDASETAALEASRAYLDVLRYRKLVELAEENYVRHRAVFEQIQKKAQAGVARKVDLEQASGRLALAEANLLTETANLHDVSARYQRLVGEMPHKDMATPPALAKDLPADVVKVFQSAQTRNPAIQAAIENLRSSDASADVRKAAYQPRVDLRLRNERGSDLNGYLGATDNRTAEVVMTWNLFNGLSDRARSRQYADQINVAKDLRDKTCRDVRQTVAIAYNDTRKLVEQLTYLDQHQLSTEKARDAYRKQFDIGQRTLLDLLDTENELFQAKRAYANAEYDLLIAQARTQAGFGNLLQTLDLTRVAKDEAPDLADWKVEGDAAEHCPPEGPTLYNVDKSALNARAAEFLRESAPQPVAEASTTPGTERELAEALKAWAQAWMTRDVPRYLGFYSPTFVPSQGRSLATWTADRKRIIGSTRMVKLDLSGIKVSMKDPSDATTTFVQAYQSPVFRDVVTKAMDWRKVDGKWLIERESPNQAMRAISTAGE
ncbi:MAG TPA: TolC family outer membrane protein [Rhodocyclaceae bacterium]|nr:TolC family outer membrane protein [Rhodocyclaceae bacterium]